MIGYCVPVVPAMASYRLRVAIPMRNLGCPARIGRGNPTFFFKHHAGDVDTLEQCLLDGASVVYDVVNDHFGGQLGDHYRRMCDLATAVTAGSETMAARVKACTGIGATVIDDPYETPESPVGAGSGVLWFGHGANLPSLLRVADDLVDADLTVCTNVRKDGFVPWSQESEARCLAACLVVLVTGDNPGASSNRIVKALRAGKFVVTNGGVPAWEQFRPFVWIGGVAAGLRWLEANREEAWNKVRMGQEYVRTKFSPWTIGQQWRTLFDSISGPETSASRAGCE